MRAWLLAVALTVAILAGLVVLIPAAPLTGDGQYYVEFVRNGLQHGASSWHERRLLAPFIVSLLPLDPLLGFQALTLGSLGVTALLMWRATVSLLAIPLFLGTWAAAPNIREYALVDPLAWVAVAAMWVATVGQRWWLVAVLGGAGVLVKEVVVLAAVAAAAASYHPSARLRPLAVAAPAVLVALLLTILFPGSGTDAFAYASKWVRDGLGSLGPLRAIYLVFASYGALWLLLPIGLRDLKPHVQRAGAVYLLAALVLPFIGSPERMEEAIFPIVITSAVAATRAWHPLASAALAAGNLLFIARVGGDARLPTVLAWSGLILATALTVQSYVRLPAALRSFPRSALRRPLPPR
jgi:hypothetical protein